MTRADVRQAFITGVGWFWHEIDAVFLKDDIEAAADRYMAEKFPEPEPTACTEDCHIFEWSSPGAQFVPTDRFRCQCGQKEWKERLE